MAQVTTDISKYVGTSGDPVANASALQSIAIAMAKQSGAIVNNNPGVIPIGSAIPGRPIVKSGAMGEWRTPGTTFRVADRQPVFDAASTTPVCAFEFVGAPRSDLQFTVDCNGAGQIASAVNNPKGYYMHGVRWMKPVAPARGDVTILNVRGVTSMTQTDPTKGLVAETFFWQTLGGLGGEDLTIRMATKDGSPSASGGVFQQIDPAGALSQLLIAAYGIRHGFGCWGGGRILIRPGSIFLNCQTLINIEAGMRGTPSVQIGLPINPNPGFPQVIAHNKGNYGKGLSINGNNPNGIQIGNVDAYDLDVRGVQLGAHLSNAAPGKVTFVRTHFGASVAAIDCGGKSVPRGNNVYLVKSEFDAESATAIAVKGGSIPLTNGKLALV